MEVKSDRKYFSATNERLAVKVQEKREPQERQSRLDLTSLDV
jgi:hypothetical protein